MNNFPSHSEYSGVHLFNHTSTSLPIGQNEVEQIVAAVEQQEEVGIEWAEVVFVDEEKILEVNQNHLNHDYVTDIITFSYNENDMIEGTLYCCAPRIKEQAEANNQPIEKEFWRVVVHGFLHLCGYDDQTEEQNKSMREKENTYLTKFAL